MKRRDFLQNTFTGVVMPALINGISFKAFGNIDENTIGDDNVLVVIQLSGGNDGLNTVIPIDKYALYQNARTNIAIPKNKLLSIPQNDTLGLNPSMTPLQTMFKEGKAALIQGVGYPNPNFSHFRATDIWNSASDSNVFINNGWAGRYLAIENPNYPTGYPNQRNPDPLAIQIGSVVSTALQGPIRSMGMAISNPSNFYDLISNKVESVPNTLAGKELKYLREVANQTNLYANSIKNAASKVTKQVTYPNSSLAGQLKIVAQLLGGGLKTKIYFVNINGFDTHSNQVNTLDTTTGTHANLLKTVTEAIKAFHQDLVGMGASKRVLGVTYSEFGRRIKSNASGGTDHGAAAPMFLFGDLVNPIVLGKSADISATPNANDNITMQYDFRSVYASILTQWFCLDEAYVNDVLLKDFQPLPLIQPQACGKITANEPTILNEELLSNYPNPFSDSTTIRFKTLGGHTMIQIFDNIGRLVAVPIDNEYEAGIHSITIDTSNYSSGMYFARLQNNSMQQIHRMMK
ncbi:protein of unknown function DUF1501 [Emticicia oligotrophica DSM 17448]|uniref:Secretion system C-terminal sorting domain-containing protein n=1 Tax=Emticicia oligotrophica (strain DSM 17448 / CIP 109782 / MTCC 6937 / GPTSA100-15) TaxID=929562 RepID=A0ABN4ATA6_EMTOG|nr:DUF1501 domain-containing protein [Emticicia oligotrophica]AFK05171.1 protein of unknown function DUF1501 [Emticicia oligotrophica DSM 17448]